MAVRRQPSTRIRNINDEKAIHIVLQPTPDEAELARTMRDIPEKSLWGEEVGVNEIDQVTLEFQDRLG